MNTPAELKPHSADMLRPLIAVDVVLLTIDEAKLKTLLLKRSEASELWGLSGGFICEDESLEAAAERVLQDKLGLKGLFLEQLYTFGGPNRDPRERVISVSYYALIPAKDLAKAKGEVLLADVNVPWAGEKGGAVSVSHGGKTLKLAFDHADILGLTVKRLRGKLNYSPIGFELLPKQFTLRQLQDVHEAILDKKLNKDSFRRRMLASKFVKATGRLERNVTHRPAELYTFLRKAF
ncbi:MAG: NUDIX domain-containing protein [Deinococcales bacterium]